MKTPLSLAAIGLSFVLVASCTSADELEDLHAKRIAALQRAADLLATSYREGQITMQQVLDANAKLLEAKLDAAKTRERRVELLTEHLKLSVTAEKYAEKLVQAGSRPAADVYLSKAARLRVEILLVKEKRRVAGDPDSPR